MNSTLYTAGVNTLLGDPKKAIIKLAIPIVTAQIAYATYSLVDMIWVAGLGPDSVSAVGFFSPLFLLISALGTGIGVGGGTCIAQRIGGNDKVGADKFAAHMFAIAFIVSLLIVVPFFFLVEPFFLFMGAGETIDLTVAYARILFLAFFAILFDSWGGDDVHQYHDCGLRWWNGWRGGFFGRSSYPVADHIAHDGNCGSVHNRSRHCVWCWKQGKDGRRLQA
ncbi:MAG: hypothetical protein GY866_04725, partial [Proteobacteria bacterium]|nr:hypothetical protein [Pseudomonadota bacterium]